MLLARLAFISCLLFGSLALSVNLGFLLEFMGKYPLRSVLVITNTKSGELSFSRSSRTFYNTFGHLVTRLLGLALVAGRQLLLAMLFQ